MAFCFALMAMVLAFAGCSAGYAIRQTTGDEHAAGAGDRAVVHFAIAADPQTLDPLFAHVDANSVEQQVARLAFEPFIDIDAHGRAIPALLARIPTIANGDLSRDGRTIVYRLRKNVHWQDGAPVTARDVLFTLHAIMDDRNPVRSREGYDRIARAERLDDNTVRFTLKAPWAPAVATLFSYGTAPQYVLPAHLLEHEANLAQAAFGAMPVGNGPYALRSWSRGDHLTFDANSRYWRGVPKIAHLDVRVVPDAGANFTALLSGALDWNLVSPSQAKVVERNRDLADTTVPLAEVFGITINTAHPPLDDVRVRRALAASIDRALISRKITFGKYPAIDTVQPLSSWAHDPTARLPAYDPRAADAAFDAAGWRRGADGMRAKNGTPLAFTYVQFPESQTGVRSATEIQAELRRRGIVLTMKAITNAKLFLPAAEGGTLATGAFDLAYVPFPMGADPDDSAVLGCHGFENYTRWCDPQVDALQQRALAATTRAERKALYSLIQHRVAAAVPLIPLFDPAYVYAYRRGLTGFAPNAFIPTWNAADWSLSSTR